MSPYWDICWHRPKPQGLPMWTKQDEENLKKRVTRIAEQELKKKRLEG